MQGYTLLFCPPKVMQPRGTTYRFESILCRRIRYVEDHVKSETGYEGVSSCDCGRCFSSNYTNESFSGSVGYSIRLKDINFGPKYRTCPDCGTWFDHNRKYFHELHWLYKILVCLGVWKVPDFSVAMLFRGEDNLGNFFGFDSFPRVLFSLLISPLIVIFFLTWAILVDALALCIVIPLNILAFPIVLPYNLVLLDKSIKEYKNPPKDR